MGSRIGGTGKKPATRPRPRNTARLGGERLESRLLLDAAIAGEYQRPNTAWFAAGVDFTDSPNNPIAASAPDAGMTDAGRGVSSWIVRLSPTAVQSHPTVVQAASLLSASTQSLRVKRGLGLPGMLLVESTADVAAVEASLASNPNVGSFERDGLLRAQVEYDQPDPDFGSLTGLNNTGQLGGVSDADIDAPEAWDITTGSSKVVVGVIDSGIDYTHPDLYLNIWINPGEVPPGPVDQDGDGLITFYDLNHAANAAWTRDGSNHNGRIDAEDLFEDIRWANGVDNDDNSFTDDLFGWNFRSDVAEPFEENDPRDASGHGTHVAGTIAAIGNNGVGVVGVNWRASLMALKFLDADNQGLTSDAVLAVNYATLMRQRGVNIPVLNASWGQSGGFSNILSAALEAAGAANTLVVAAAGNGNLLGHGIDNDGFPFYPASYDLENVIAVAASDSFDQLASFSNFGPGGSGFSGSVDLAAPGVGVLSTLPNGRYGSASGTSMATPHVAGAAALVWSHVPYATVAEVREALLASVDKCDPDPPGDPCPPEGPLAALRNQVASGGRLNAHRALTSDVFAPHATLVRADDIVDAGSDPYGRAVLSSHPVAYWRMETSQSPLDSAATPGFPEFGAQNGAYQNISVFDGQNTIGTGDGAHSVFGEDVDGDGDTDLLSASFFDNRIAWYENNGNQSFTVRTISTTAVGAISVFAADLDGDEDMDVLSASSSDNTIAWYQNDGNEIFTERTISTAALEARSVFAADVDRDGDLDVLSASASDDRIAWYENNGAQSFTAHTISTAADWASSVFAADVDTDGDVDILSASRFDNKIAWYENNGNQTFISRTISTTAIGAFAVFATDVDRDGDTDVLSASLDDDKIAWYENDGSENFTARVITTATDRPGSVFAADMDGDGDTDLLSASTIDDKIAWYEHRVATADPSALLMSYDPNGLWRFSETLGTSSNNQGNGGDALDGTWFASPNLGQAGPQPPAHSGFESNNSATAFNGTSNYMEAADGAILSNASQFTVMGWVRRTAAQAPRAGLWGQNDAIEVGFISDATLQVWTPGGGALDVAWPFGNDGLWHHVAIVGDGTSLKTVIDGVVRGTGGIATSNYGSSTFPFRVGGGGVFDATGNFFNGDIDEVAVWANAALLEQQIQDYYSASGGGVPTFAAHTISTAADDALSVFAADIDQDGDLDVASASFGDDKIAWYENVDSAGPRPTDLVDGRELIGFSTNNRAIDFQGNADGGNDVALFPDDGQLNMSSGKAFTLEAWVKGNPAQEDGAAILAKGTGNGGEQFSLDVYAGKYRFYGWTGGVPNTAPGTSAPFGPSGNWDHLVATFDSAAGIMRLYVNGQLAGSTTPPATIVNNSHAISVGARQSGDTAYDFNFDGLIDEVAVYAHALSPQEVQAHFEAAFLRAPYAPQQLVVEYEDTTGVSFSSLGDDDLTVTRLDTGDPLPGVTLVQVFAAVAEQEPNDSLAMAHDITAGPWTRAFDRSIDQSTSVPHHSIDASGDGTFDHYRLDVGGVPVPVQLFFDVDFPAGTIPSFVPFLQLYDLHDNPAGTLIREGSLAWHTDFGPSDPPFPLGFTIPATSSRPYVLKIGSATGGGVPQGAQYRLHVSYGSPPAVVNSAKRVTAVYEVTPPDGAWDALDIGTYDVALGKERVFNTATPSLAARAGSLGEYAVRIEAPNVIYVNSFVDALDAVPGTDCAATAVRCVTLRAAIQEANAAIEPRIIILEPGIHQLEIAGVGEDLAATGDLDIRGDITILGAGQTETVIDAAGLDRVFDVRSGRLSVLNATIRGGTAQELLAPGITPHGGGVRIAAGAAAEFDNVAVSDNVANEGGGILNHGRLHLLGSLISGNRAHAHGGGVMNRAVMTMNESIVESNSAAGLAGGLYNDDSAVANITRTELRLNSAAAGGAAVNDSTMTVDRSTVADNVASSTGGISTTAPLNGGLVVTNSTIANNRSTSQAGGAVFGSVTMRHTTVTGNIGGGLYTLSGVELVISHSIVAGNTTGDANFASDIACTLPCDTNVSEGHNLFANIDDDVRLHESDRYSPGAGRRLAPLADHGGPTRTVALLPGSLAIDGGTFTLPDTFALDQRSVPRRADGNGDNLVLSDIGAFELSASTVHGRAFVDADGDRFHDSIENGMPGIAVFLDSDGDGVHDVSERTTLTEEDDPATVNLNEAGVYAFEVDVPQTTEVSVGIVAVPNSWDTTARGIRGIERLMMSADGNEPDGDAEGGVFISDDGRFISFESRATNLLPGDEQNLINAFLADRWTGNLTHLEGGRLAGLSGDGRFAVLLGRFAGPSNPIQCIVYDRLNRWYYPISAGAAGWANAEIYNPSISDDGRYIAFVTSATNLVGPASPGNHVFLVTRDLENVDPNIIQLVDRGLGGMPADGPAWDAQISGDGRTVAFFSSADNLIVNDTNTQLHDLFFYNRETQFLVRVDLSPQCIINPAFFCANLAAVSDDGRFAVVRSEEGVNPVRFYANVVDRDTRSETTFASSDRPISALSISDDGRWISAVATKPVGSGVSNYNLPEVLLFDWQSDNVPIERINSGHDGTEPFFGATGGMISGDGRSVAFLSKDNNLVSGDTNGAVDVFVRSTIVSGFAQVPWHLTLTAGDTITGIDFGIRPLDGSISGRAFWDENRNGFRDSWEPGQPGSKVYLDLNENGRHDPATEPSRTTDSNGDYSFNPLEALKTYTVAIAPPSGWSVSLPTAADQGRWRVFVPAAGAVGHRDFGIYQSNSGGASTGTAIIRGNVRNAAGSAVSRAKVFLDLNDNGTKQSDEPITETDASGGYQFGSLGSRSYTVRLDPGDDARQTSPIGNTFTRHTFANGSLVTTQTAQAIVLGDLNGDGKADVMATANQSPDTISLFLKGANGQFGGQPITLQLPQGSGPVDLVWGRFNGDPRLDLAVAQLDHHKVTVLFDFNGAGFSTSQVLVVGNRPRAIAAGDLDADGDADLVVANEGPNACAGADTISILVNNSNNGFLSPLTLPVGNVPVDVALGHFNDDDRLDIAVAHAGNAGLSCTGAPSDSGGVAVLLKNGTGQFDAPTFYATGIGAAAMIEGILPKALTVGDFNNDGRDDIATANLLSDNVSLLYGTGTASGQTLRKGGSVPAGAGPMEIRSGDLDGDGNGGDPDLDLVVANGYSSNVSVLRNRGQDRGFEPAEAFGVGQFADRSRNALDIAHLDDDGDLDVAVVRASVNNVFILSNQITAGAHRVALTGSGEVTGLDFTSQSTNTLRVVSLVPRPSGFELTFNRSPDPSALNLFDVQGSTLGPADLSLVGQGGAVVVGSAVVSGDKLSFVATAGVLAAGSYTLTLRSASDAFRTEDLILLDGNGDGVGGDDFSQLLTIDPPNPRVVSLSHFARGPGQPVNIPTTAVGLPVTINDGAGLQAVDFTLRWDPALLNVSSINAGSGWTITIAPNYSLGTAVVGMFRTSPIATSGPHELLRLIANVPNTAPYKSSHAIRIDALRLNGSTQLGTAPDTIHKVAYLGDASGRAGYHFGEDPTKIARVVVGLDPGFAAYPLTDPFIIGHVSTVAGPLSSLDTALVAAEAVDIDVPQIPPLPDPLPFTLPPSSGPDPVVAIPHANGVSPGTTLELPVNVQDPAGLHSARIRIRYDAQVFDIQNEDVTLGPLVSQLTANDSNWFLEKNVNPSTGTITVLAYSAVPLPDGIASGDLLRINFHVRPSAPSGATTLDVDDLASFLNGGSLSLTDQDGQVDIRSHLPGDLNLDGRVDREDLVILVTSYGHASATAAQGDLNSDGRIGVRDLIVMQANWEPAAPSPPGALVATPLSTNPRTRIKAARSPATVDHLMAAEDPLFASPGRMGVLSARRRH